MGDPDNYLFLDFHSRDLAVPENLLTFSEEIPMKSQAQVLEHEQEIPFGDPEPGAPMPASQTGLVNREPESSREIAAVKPQTMSDQLISMAIDKDLDITKLQQLIEMRDREEQKTAKSQFDRAMAIVQAGIQPVLADADNDQTGSKYSKLPTIVTALKPIYTAEGFSVAYKTDETPIKKLAEGGWFRILAVISHVGGHSETYHVDLPADTTGIKGSVNKTMIHGIKSTISYARNILLGLIFNFVSTADIDDDGNAAGAMQAELITDHEIVVINEAIEAGVVDKKGLLAFAKVDDFTQIEMRNWGTIHALIQRKYKIAEKANG